MQTSIRIFVTRFCFSSFLNRYKMTQKTRVPTLRLPQSACFAYSSTAYPCHSPQMRAEITRSAAFYRPPAQERRGPSIPNSLVVTYASAAVCKKQLTSRFGERNDGSRIRAFGPPSPWPPAEALPTGTFSSFPSLNSFARAKRAQNRTFCRFERSRMFGKFDFAPLRPC